MSKKLMAALLLTTLSYSCHAQKYLGMEMPSYPSAELLPEIEADVNIRVTVNAEGKPENIVVSESSGFPPLDKAALAAVGTAKFAPKTDADGKPVAANVILPISFKRGSPIDRPCIGLNNEMTEFARFNPGSVPEDFKTVAVLKGALVTGLFSSANPNSSMVGRTKNLKLVWDDIVTQCAAEPKSMIVDVMRANVKKHAY